MRHPPLIVERDGREYAHPEHLRVLLAHQLAQAPVAAPPPGSGLAEFYGSGLALEILEAERKALAAEVEAAYVRAPWLRRVTSP